MTRLDQARAIYRRTGEDFDRALWFHLEQGYVFAAPGILLIARPVALYGPHDDAWWIEYLAGSLPDAISLMPFWLPYVAFYRNCNVKAYATAKIVNRVLKNGSVDAVSRRGGSGEDQAAAVATGSVDGC